MKEESRKEEKVRELFKKSKITVTDDFHTIKSSEKLLLIYVKLKINKESYKYGMYFEYPKSPHFGYIYLAHLIGNGLPEGNNIGFRKFIFNELNYSYDIKYDLILAGELVNNEGFKNIWNDHWSKYGIDYKRL